MSGKSELPKPEVPDSPRLLPLDALRGLIIVLMALDHASWFVAQKHPSSEMWGGSFPVYNDALSFLTRFVTHIAAPGFFILLGAGMSLFAHSRQTTGWSKGEVMRHFWLRGLLLMALQLLVVNRAWELSPGGWQVQFYIGVLFALGGAMILGNFLVWLKPFYLLVVTIILFFGTELLVPDPGLWGQIQYQSALENLALLLVRPGGTLTLWSNYPILPWLELVTFGMIIGAWLLENAKRTYDLGLKLGGAFIVVFAVLRYLDGFGNIRPRPGNTWIDFLNLVKYPPSMTFTLLTTGIILVLLWLFARINLKWSGLLYPLSVYGRAPLLFYLLHLFLYAAIGIALEPAGTSLPAMIPYWILGLLLLFPICIWYRGFKRRQPLKSVFRFL